MIEVGLEPGHHDLVIAGGICHLFDEPTNTMLVATARVFRSRRDRNRGLC
jgi:hypothetical protein